MKKQIIFLIIALASITLQGQIQILATSTNLNFRTQPKVENHNIICAIPKGTIVFVDLKGQEFQSWVRLVYNGRTGYVHSAYLISPAANNQSELGGNRRSNHYSGFGVKYYTNTRGERVQSPTYYSSPPAGATAECRDGTYSFSRSRRGTCSSHGGVRRWLR